MEKDPPVTVPPGAFCAVHEGLSASFVCTRCGTFGCPTCAFAATRGLEICQACAEGGLSEPIPWERRAELGRIRALWETTKLVMLSTTPFFRTPATEKGAIWPIVYGLSVYTIGQMLYLLTVAVAVLIAAGVLGITTEGPELGLTLAGGSICWMLMMIPMALLQAPINALFGILGGGGLAHLTLVLMKQANGTFEDTLRAVSFANAPYLLVFIPGCGHLVSWGWMVRSEVIALRETHRITTDRAAIAAMAYRIAAIVGVMFVYGAVMAVAYVLGTQAASAPMQ